MNKYDIELGKFLAKQRKSLGITQAQLAGKFNFTTSVFISLVESGKSRLPNEHIVRMAKELDTSYKKIADYLYKAAREDIRAACEKKLY